MDPKVGALGHMLLQIERRPSKLDDEDPAQCCPTVRGDDSAGTLVKGKVTAAQHSSAAAVLRSAKSDEMKAVLCEHSATLTVPEECRAGNIAGIFDAAGRQCRRRCQERRRGCGSPSSRRARDD